MATNVGEVEKMAKNAFFDDQFQQSIDLFTQAIELNPNNPHLYADRALVYLKIAQFKEALADSTKAIKLDPSMPKAFLRKGAALLKLDNYQAAKTEFQAGAALAPQDSRFTRFNRSCDRHLEEEEIGISSGGSITDSDLSPTMPDEPEFSHEYYQNNDEVFVTIFAEKIPAERVSVDYGEHNLSVRIDTPGQEPYHLQLKLYGEIIPDNSSHEVCPTTIEIRLAKAESAESDDSSEYLWWRALEAFEDRRSKRIKV